MDIVFATNNAHKLEEVQKLVPKEINILSLQDIGCFDEIEETGKTLAQNAIIKADYITNKFNCNCFADDTGLEVVALNGAPGVYSARYAGKTQNAEANMQKLLNNLDGITNRSAQFTTVIALNLDGKQYLFEGVCKGEISLARQGEKGFGYDPVFKPEGYNKSFAEMSMDEKGAISHRGKAIQKLIAFLHTIY